MSSLLISQLPQERKPGKIVFAGILAARLVGLLVETREG